MVNASNDAAATRANIGAGNLVRGAGGDVTSNAPDSADGLSLVNVKIKIEVECDEFSRTCH